MCSLAWKILELELLFGIALPLNRYIAFLFLLLSSTLQLCKGITRAVLSLGWLFAQLLAWKGRGISVIVLSLYCFIDLSPFWQVLMPVDKPSGMITSTLARKDFQAKL
jgi:hypothetical protein